MSLEIKPTPKLTYKLRLTPQVKLALNLLQLPLVQLKEYIKQEIEKNPLLEPQGENLISHKEKLNEVIRKPQDREDDKCEFDMPWTEENEEKREYQESLITKSYTLQEYLSRQLRLLAKSKEDFEIGEFIIGNINENGYFTDSIEEVAKTFKVDISKVKEVLSLIQTLDPVGIGARDLRECLLLQLESEGKENSLAGKVVDKYLPYLEKKRYKFIAKRLNVTVQKVKEKVKEIAQLEPKPGRIFSTETTIRLIPDATVKKNKQGYEVILNDRELPSLNLNVKYINMIKQKNIPENTKGYLRERLKIARSLINAVKRRKETIQEVIEDIVNFQEDYFDKEIGNFRPMTLSQIANRVGKHKSTVSRAIANKYLQTPYGIIELRQFLNPGVKQTNGQSYSSKNIKLKISEWIRNEDKKKPLTDQDIADLFKQKRISVSRRTITKYRTQLKILPSESRQE